MKEVDKWRVSSQKNGQVKSEPTTKRNQVAAPPPARIATESHKQKINPKDR